MVSKYLHKRIASDLLPTVDSGYSMYWNDVKNILSSPLWSRGWICQGLTVSQGVILVYGGQAIPWETFLPAYQIIVEMVNLVYSKTENMKNLSEIKFFPVSSGLHPGYLVNLRAQ
jgi:hypothetical protein